MPVRVVSAGRGMYVSKRIRVIKKPEEIVGKGKKEMNEIVLKVEQPKKYVAFS
jgi:hypothetical protein